MSYFIALLGLALISSIQGAAYNQTLALKFWDFIRITDCSVANIQSLSCGPICSQFSNDVKYIEVAFNDSTNMLAWIGYSKTDDVIYISFRGSIGSIENWLHNFDYFQQDYPNPSDDNAYPPKDLNCTDCKVHSGFYSGYYSLREQILTSYKSISAKSGCKKIFVVGYSLGAAMSIHGVLDIIETQKQFTAVGLYTFGCPRTGNQNFANFFDGIVPNAYRITHFKDIVPHVPQILMGFYHTKQEVWYSSDTTLDHVLCAGGEDPNCADSEKINNVYDHLHYMNEDVDVLKNYCNGIEGFLGKFLNAKQ